MKNGGNILAEKYGNDARWVNWRLETRKGKQTKVPYSPITGKMASSTDAKTWGTFEDVAKKDIEHVGIVFTPAQDLLGIDIDHCVEDGKIVHAEADAIRALIEKADTYTELSPSKTGLHLYLALSAPLKLAHNKIAPFEVYTSGRYFTATNDGYGVPHPVRVVSPEEALAILALTGHEWSDKEEVAPTQTSYLDPIDDDLILKKMFESRNGAAIKALYDGDTSAYRKDESSADMALLSHLAFWTGKNAGQMEHLWIMSPLGKRKKTQQRGDYRERSVAAAIKHCKEVYTPQPGGTETKPDELDLLYTIHDKQKTYIQNTENMCRILRKHPDFAGTLRLDMFRAQMERKVNGAWRQLEDTDAIDVQTKISVLFSQFRKVGKDMVYDAIFKVCKENEYDSAADYMRALVWDKTPRLDSWLSVVYGTPNDVLHQKIGSNWLKGLVKRITSPGCKFDYVLVLEGEQGIKKSTSLGVLGGDWHVETTMSTDTKDFFMQFQGKAIIEFSEGETLSRTEVKRMKAIITVQSDKFRPPYGRNSVDNPRRCVFAMTTNQSEYLKDETGNRRWLPVAVRKVADIDWLRDNRDQLFAEAYHRVVNLKETTYEFPEEEITRAQNERRVHDPNTERIVDWYLTQLAQSERDAGITVYQVFVQAMQLGFAGKAMSRYEEMSIADVLKSGLCLEKRQAMTNGVRASRWFATPATPKLDIAADVKASAMQF